LTRPIKVLHVITSLHVGGAETMLYRLLSARTRDSFDCMVLSLTTSDPFGGQLEAAGCTVKALGMRKFSPHRLLAAVPHARAWQPDIIQGWMYHGNLAATFLQRFVLPQPRMLWNIRHSLSDLRNEKPATRLVIRIGALLSRRPVQIIYNSRTSAQQHAALGYCSESSHVMHNGFATDVFRPDPAAYRSVRHELDIPQGGLIAGMIGRYHPTKDHANLIAAAGLIRDENTWFVLVGREVDAHNAGLISLIRAHNLESRVRLLGERNDTPRLNAAFDVAVSASRGEGFPNAVGEAMACGIPCVVTDVGDSGFLVGETGIVVPPGDSAALAQGIRIFLEANAEKRREMGVSARSRIVDTFSLYSVVRSYERLLTESAALAA
jgi:glycosyltransferase involved in cell wall biosynthesis